MYEAPYTEEFSEQILVANEWGKSYFYLPITMSGVSILNKVATETIDKIAFL